MQQQQADGSYQELWPKVDGWNKSQVLSDLTRELLGLESTSIPDDAFIALTIGKDSKAYRVKVTYPNGQPAVGFTVGGLTAFPALGLVTNANGMVMGSSTSTNPTITVAQKYDDVKAYSGSFTSTRMITDCNITLEWSNSIFPVSTTNNKSFNISIYATKLEYLIVGGGRSGVYGGTVMESPGGRGGGGGYYKFGQFNFQQGNKITVVIGAGGQLPPNGQSPGNKGRNSSITVDDGQSEIADGGEPGQSGETTYSSETINSRKYYKRDYKGGSGGRGNGNGGVGGSGYYYEDSDGDFISHLGYEYGNGSNGIIGALVTFSNGDAIQTGGGGGGGKCYISPDGYAYSGSDGVSASSQAGRGGQGSSYISSTVSSGEAGGCWCLFIH